MRKSMKATALFFLFLAITGGLSAPSASGSEKQPAIDIDRIEISGATRFSPESLRSALELAEGDQPEAGRIVRSAENLQALYRRHGYEQAAIRTQLLRRSSEEGRSEEVLQFIITEGKPTRISSIEVVPDDVGTAIEKRSWSKLEPLIRSSIELKPGEVFDQEKMATDKRAVVDALVAKDFIGARADEVRVVTADSPDSPDSRVQLVSGTDTDTEAARWVSIIFHVNPGERVSFGFQGNTVFSASRLLALVEEQRLLGLGKDYIGAIRSRIQSEYNALGYAGVRVEAFTRESPSRQERHVTYRIEEGERIRLEGVEFDGNQLFSEQELRKEYFRQASPLLRQGYYSEKEAQKAAELVIEWMKSKGYLSAKLITISAVQSAKKRADQKSHGIRLTVYLYESEQTIIRHVRISGARAITDEEIRRTLGVKEGDALNLYSFSEGIENLKAQYRAKGFLAAKIVNEGTDRVVMYTSENRMADITLEFDEGIQYRAGRVMIDGLSSTKTSVVRRELQFKEDEILEEPKITESEARLRRLGIFSTVSIRLIEGEKEGYKTVRVFVQEGTPGVYAVGAGFRNDLGLRLFWEVGYSNVGGRNHTLSLSAVANRRFGNDYHFGEYESQLSYLWPWFLGDVNFRPTLTATGRQYYQFDARTVSMAATWEKNFYSKLVGSLTANIERVRQFNAQETIDNQTLNIGSLIPALRLDLRDNPLAPTSGLFASSSFELAAPWLLSEAGEYPFGYWRFQFRSDYFLPIVGNSSLYFSFRSGFIKATYPSLDALGRCVAGDIPLIKQFTLGGVGSLRGFEDQELNEQDVAICGTQSYVNYRTQIDFPLSGSLRVGPFVDAGNLQVDSFSFGNLRYGAGFGFHYLTPVGPVNLDFGFKLDRNSLDTKSSAVYFSIGII